MEYYGNYKRKLFRDSNSGLTFFILRSGSSEITCKGNIPELPSGFPMYVEGECDIGSLHPDTLVTTNIQYVATAETTLQFIESGFIAGIKAIKKRILACGDNCIEASRREDLEMLFDDLADETRTKALNFFWRIRDILQIVDVYEYISPFGGTYNNAERVCENRPNALKELKDDVYAVGTMSGLAFDVCDSIYKSEGGYVYSSERMIALVTQAMSRVVLSGHTFCDRKTLISASEFYARHSAFKEYPLCEPLIIVAAFNAPKIVIEKSGEEYRFYRRDLYYYEKSIVSNINRLSEVIIPTCESEIDFDIKKARVIINAKKEGIVYSEKQKNVFDFLKTNGIKILTGGPGTGKTTVMKGLISLYSEINPNGSVLLCAPTGRAAQKLSEATGLPASTLHRALNVKPYKDTLTSKNEDDPLDYSLIIVDEMSMADTAIFSILVSAVKSDAILILCGDSDQLPSVGAGNVLHDLIKSNKIEMNFLDVIYRQSGESYIVRNATNINLGISRLATNADFEVIECEDEKQMSETICELVRQNYDASDPFALQVLSSTKKGEAGTFQLNGKIKEICNPAKASVVFGNCQYSIGDKIITTHNNYEQNFVNGDIGTITSVNDTMLGIDIKGTGRLSVDKTALADITLGYAITIHKSQGTEYDTVIVSLPDNPVVMLKRNLLYTAITRAKKRIIIVTQKETVAKAVNTLDTAKRRTGVCDKLLHGIPKTMYNKGGLRYGSC